jgi:outer membrane protein OmpA-like peptidoglycan-associated protein
LRAAAAALVLAGGFGSLGCAHDGCARGECARGQKAPVEDHYRNWYDTNWPDRYDYAARQSVLAPFAQQAANGHFLHQTIWNFYFEPGSDKLTPGGMEKLDTLARTNPGPDTKIYIQTSRDLVVTPETAEKNVALRSDLDARRAAAIQRYLNTQPGGAITYEIAVHDAPVPGMPAIFAGQSFRSQRSGYVGGLSSGSIGNGSVGGGGAGGLPTGNSSATTNNTNTTTSTNTNLQGVAPATPPAP